MIHMIRVALPNQFYLCRGQEMHKTSKTQNLKIKIPKVRFCVGLRSEERVSLFSKIKNAAFWIRKLFG